MDKQILDNYVAAAIKEDIGDGDHTSLACIPNSAKGKMKLLVKQEGIIAGVDIACQIFESIDTRIELDVCIEDGTKIALGDVVLYAEGPVQSLLKAERLVLNVMQRMSGIATVTAQYVEQVKGTKAQVLDTRKTTPNNRLIEKEAVRIGGGTNHRFGLYDMVMIKDNHVDFSGGIKNAVLSTVAYLEKKGKTLPIEVEVRGFEELEEALSLPQVDRIMLDNFSVEDTAKAVALTDGRCALESSGGITLESIAAYAQTGVDYISVGALTHQIFSLDLSLKAVELV